MAFTETLEALGSWELELVEETPDEVMAQLGFLGHLVLVDGPVDVVATGNGLLPVARYVGVCRAWAKPRSYIREGSGMLFWLGDEDGKGHRIEAAPISLTNATLAQVVTALLPPTVTVGTVFPQANPATRYTNDHVFQSRRDALAVALAPFGAELRVNPNFTVDVGTPAQLYDTALPLTSKPSPMIVRKGAGSDLDLVAVGGKVETEGAGWDYSTRIVVVGETIGTGDEPDTVFALGAVDAPSVPYKDPQGNQAKFTRFISASSETTASAPVTAALNLNRFNRLTTAVKVTADDYEISGGFGVGDAAYVYDPDSGILDTSIERLFRGEPIHPAIIRVSSLTTPIVEGMTVAWRTDAGVWLDLTRWVVWESAGTREITVGDLPKTLSRPSDPIQDRVDAARGNPSTKVPKTPTGLSLSTSSALNPVGADAAVITATWSAVTQYVDNTTVALHHYEVQFRPTFRAPQWLASSITASTSVDLAVVAALGYDVQVRAVSTGGVASAWSSPASITSAADSTGPATPADPVVTQYLGLLRIYWNGLTSGGGAMPSDFNRVDVHVGTSSGFTPSAATLVSSLSAAGYAHAQAPYGSTRWVKFLAYDHNGNPSSASATVSAATVQAAAGDIASVNIGALVSGTGTFDMVNAGRITTALTGARREINSVGFQAFDASNNLLINLDGVNNLLTGIFKTALSGRRIEIGSAGATGTISFIAPDGTTSLVRGFTSGLGGVEAIQVSVPIAGAASSWNGVIADSGETVFAVSKAIYMIFGGASSGAGRVFSVDYAPSKADPGPRVSRLYITPTSAQMMVPDNGDFFVTERTSSDGTLTARMYFGGAGLTGLYRVAHQPLVLGDVDYGTDSYAERFRIDDFEFHFKFFGPTQGRISITPYVTMATGFSPDFTMLQSANYGARIRYVDNGAGSSHSLHIRDAGDTTHIPITASAFTVSSSEETKTGIGPWTGSATEKIRALELAGFRRKGARTVDGEEVAVDGAREIGVIAGSVAVAVPELAVTDPDGVVIGVDLGQTLWTTVAMAKELDARLKLVEERTAA